MSLDQLARTAEDACNASARWPNDPRLARLAADAVQDWSDAQDECAELCNLFNELL